MPDKHLRRKAFGSSVLLSVLLCAAVYWWHSPTNAFLWGSAVGLLCMVLGVQLFFAAWCAAPVQANVALLYGLRLAVVFGSVLVAMFVPLVDALGVLLPQLLPLPVLAVLMVILDFSKGGSR